MSKRNRNFFDWLLRDKRGRVVVLQWPNAPLAVAGLAWLALLFVPAGPWHTVLNVVFHAGLIVWAAIEVVWGSSNFRRILGAVVLTWVLYGLVTTWVL